MNYKKLIEIKLINHIIFLYEKENMTISDIVKEVNINRTKISSILKENGILLNIGKKFTRKILLKA